MMNTVLQEMDIITEIEISSDKLSFIDLTKMEESYQNELLDVRLRKTAQNIQRCVKNQQIQKEKSNVKDKDKKKNKEEKKFNEANTEIIVS